MGFETFGFGFGREDVWEPEEIFWGPEDTWLGDERYSGDRELAGPLGAVQMGLIYVNPEGPNGNPDPLAAARDIRETFAPHGDERRGDGRADRRRPHLRQVPRRRRPRSASAPSPRACPVEAQGLGWTNTGRHRRRRRHDHQRPRGRVDQQPDPVGQRLPRQPVRATSGSSPRARPARSSGRPKDPEAQDTVPDAHDPTKRHAPMMLTTDLALRIDPVYEEITQRFREHPDELADAFAKAWYKLLHRDMGPVSRFLGPWVPEPQLWQDPVPAVDHELVGDDRRRRAEGEGPRLGPVGLRSWSPPRGRRRPASAAPTSAAAPTAPASASRRRRTGPCNEPDRARRRCCRSSRASSRTSTRAVRRQAGLAGRPRSSSAAAQRSRRRRRTPASTSPCRSPRVAPTPPRSRPTSTRSRCSSRRPTASATTSATGEKLSPETLLLDRANLLTLTAPEMTVLVGGMRALGANCGGSKHGVLHRPAGHADQRLLREPARLRHRVEGVRADGERLRGPGPRDAATSSGRPPRSTSSSARNSQLRALAEVYGQRRREGEVRAATSSPPGTRS